MATKIFVNLPVKDLDRSVAFFKALGYDNNPQFTDETAACIVISEYIYAMLLTHDKFRQFTRNEIADATKTTEVLTCLSVDNRDEVDRIADTALRHGATVAHETMDYGFMFHRSFHDPDGHVWEIVWMDEAAMHEQVGKTA